MARPRHCRYCKCKMKSRGEMCATCSRKLAVLRKLRAIIFAIKEEAERNNGNDTKRINAEAPVIQKTAS